MNKFGGKDNRILVTFLIELAETNTTCINFWDLEKHLRLLGN